MPYAISRLLSRFLRALFQFSKRAAGEATKFSRGGVKLLGVVGAARLECGEPAAESGELIRRQLGNSFGDFFNFHGAQLTSSIEVKFSTFRLNVSDAMDLEKIIDDLVHRKKKLDLDSLEYQLINRILTGLRYSYEDAGGIIEDLDPFGWGATCRPLAASPATEPWRVLPFRRSE